MNIRDFKINIPHIEKTVGYVFRDKSLLMQAFTRTSFCNEENFKAKIKHQSNEVLEFFGDGVLSLAIITYLLSECTERYEHGIKTELKEGDFSNIKSKLSDKKNLSDSTSALGLEKYLLMGEGDAKLGISNEPSVMEDLFESIIGAIYIDSGMDMQSVMKSVSKMLDVKSYISNDPPIQSSKNALQEFCASKKRRLPQPVYKTVGESGPDHKKVYERGVYISERLVATGKGKNQKLADAAAAEAALEILRNEEAKTKETPAPVQKKNADNAQKKKKQEFKAKKGSIAEPSSKAKVAPVSQKPSKIDKASANTESKSRALRAYALSKKTASPIFRDLGEIKSKNGKSEYRVECVYKDKSIIGTGTTRPEAKEAAAAGIMKSLTKRHIKKQ